MSNLVYRHLTDDGLPADGTNQNANVNGSITPVPFYAGPPSDKIWDVERMIITIEDNANFTAANYGGVATLSTGVEVFHWRGGVSGTEVLDLTDNIKVTSVTDWADICYDMTYYEFGSGNNFAVVRWTFAKAGAPLVLKGHTEDKLAIRINDDLTGLVRHQFFVQGVEHDYGEFV